LHPSPERFFFSFGFVRALAERSVSWGLLLRFGFYPSVRRATCKNGPICFILFLLAVSFGERRKGGAGARLKCNQRVEAVGEGFDKKLESVGRDFRRRVVARHTPNTRKLGGLLSVSKRFECA
jgi:hypothetical protein